jgi:hypothetical protein
MPIFQKIALLCGLLMLFCVSSAATAQDASDVAESPLASIYACFDGEVATVKAREASKEILAIDADVAKDLQKESFGFSLPSLPKLSLPKLGGGDGPEEMRLAIKEVRKSGRDYVIEMENGQIWRQTGGRLNYVPRGDIEAIITSAAMGSFKMKITDGKSTVRGLRVRRVE